MKTRKVGLKSKKATGGMEEDRDGGMLIVFPPKIVTCLVRKGGMGNRWV